MKDQVCISQNVWAKWQNVKTKEDFLNFKVELKIKLVKVVVF